MFEFLMSHNIPVGLIAIGCLTVWNGVRGMRGKGISTLTTGEASLRNGILMPVPEIRTGAAARSLGIWQAASGVATILLGSVLLWRTW